MSQDCFEQTVMQELHEKEEREKEVIRFLSDQWFDKLKASHNQLIEVLKVMNEK